MDEETKVTPPVSAAVKALVKASSEVTQAKWEKQEHFTMFEDKGLAFWLEAVLRGKFAMAVIIRTAFLRVEHWRSLLADDLRDAGEDELAILTQLTKEFDASIKNFVQRTRPGTSIETAVMPERPGAR